jgi:hypothetical protein
LRYERGGFGGHGDQVEIGRKTVTSTRRAPQRDDALWFASEVDLVLCGGLLVVLWCIAHKLHRPEAWDNLLSTTVHVINRFHGFLRRRPFGHLLVLLLDSNGDSPMRC